MAHDLRLLLRLAAGRKGQTSAVILDARTVQSTPESGAHAGYDGHKRRNGAKVHVAVDTLGHLLAAAVTPASEQERAQVADLAKAVQAVTGESVALAYVDQGYTGTEPADAAAEHRASSWRWSNRPTLRDLDKGSFCCQIAGSSNARLRGWLGAGGWHATMSACRRLWQGSPFWPSPA